MNIKHFLPRSLFGRSLLILIIPVLLIQIITTIVFFDRHWEKLADRLAHAAAGEIAAIVDFIDSDVVTGPDQISDISNIFGLNLDLIISYRQGELGPQKQSKADGIKGEFVLRTFERALNARLKNPYSISVDTVQKFIDVDVLMDDGVLKVRVPQGRLFSSSSYIFILWMIATSTILLSIAIIFMRNQIRPIRKLAAAAERLGKGQDIPSSFKPAGAREVRQAAQSFLVMRDRIFRQVQQRTAMLAGISHDLRTPLTRIKLQASMMPDNEDVKLLQSDVQDMEKMINAYLEFIRGEGDEDRDEISLLPVLMRLKDKYNQQGKTINIDCPAGLILSARPIAFERCLGNLLGNAVKHAEIIDVKARNDNENILITIDDNGPGIPEDQYEEMFKPFVSGDPSRSGSGTAGIGLGLAITQDIINSHGGEIILGKSPAGGLRVKITLPV